ncbi:MAG: deoxyribonuclease IV [Phycisphaerales bacterium]|nr:deoxyribonuclease IV [Phycisphaerales bacterium]
MARRSLRLGSHLSIAGGMRHAIEASLELGFNTLQVFVKNQRQWRAAPFQTDDLAKWHELLAANPGFGPVVAHATYLINLASADDALREKSRDAFTEELSRCDTLGIPYLVVHPGAAGTQPVEEATRRVAASLDEVYLTQPGLRCMTLLETTAGQGTTLGRSMTELGAIISATRSKDRIGVCVDTCHVFAAGYDIRDEAAWNDMLSEADDAFGLDRVRCWHMNDSKGACGSRLDRHAHIGAGEIGLEGFRRVLAEPRFAELPLLMETPKDEDGRSHDLDRMNADKLYRLYDDIHGEPGAAARQKKKGA